MKRWIKLLVTIALTISIPLQGFAAVSMPTCDMSQESMKTNIMMASSHTNVGMKMDYLGRHYTL